MRALHIVRRNPTEATENRVIFDSPFETAYVKLQNYLGAMKGKKNELSYESHELVITRLLHSLGQAALSEALSHYDVDTDVISVGDQTYRFSHKALGRYQSGLGAIEVERRMYSNRKKDGDGRCICPLELQSGVIEGYWTPTGAKNSIWALAHLTPQETENLFLQLGTMSPSRSSLDRLPKALNQGWEPQTIPYHEAIFTDEKIPSNAVSCSVSLDGVMVGMKPVKSMDDTKSVGTEWKEASCGTISFFDAKGNRLSTVHYGRMPEHKKATLKTLLCKNIETILRQKPELKLVHLADGAQDNWTFFDEEMPLGFQLTDFYHASTYLKAAFDAAYPKNNEKACMKFETYQKILRDEINGVNRTLRALRHLRSQHKTNKTLEASVTYFTNNQHRMRYAEAKNKGYPIGSGIVEASCKTLVGQRLKRAGMSWQHNGGQGILTFRALIKSNRFDKAWDVVAKQYKKNVIAHKNIPSLVGQNIN